MTLLNEQDAVYMGTDLLDKVYLGDTLVWEPQSAGWGPPESILDPLLLPGEWTMADYTVGMRFTVQHDGRLTHLRVYSVSNTAGTLRLWGVTGHMVFDLVKPAGIGWHDVAMPTPLEVRVGETYIASVYSPATTGYGYSQPMPVSLSSNLTLEEGRYTPGDTGFPIYVWAGGHYHVDVIYQESPSNWGPDESMYSATVPGAGNIDNQPFSVGSQFTVLVAGRITGLRFYNNIATSRHTALWTDAGVKLAEGYSAATVGWQVVPISPVAVTANQVLRVAFAHEGGLYVLAANPPPGPHLRWETGCFGGYGSDATAFPSDTYSESYAADVVFQRVLPAEGVPSSIPGLGLWLEADKITDATNGGPLTTWPDASGQSHHAVPVAAAPTWQQAGMNGKPTVKFSSSRMTVPGWGTALSGKSEYTLFQVLSQQNFGTYPVITTAPTYAIWQWITEFGPAPAGSVYWGHTNGNFYLYDAKVPQATPTLLTYSYVTGAPKLFKNGVQVTAYASTGAGLGSIAVPSLGADVVLGAYYDGQFPLDNHVAAVLWYDKFLIDSERIQVENYLKQKYGIA